MISGCASLEAPLIRTLPKQGASCAEIFQKTGWGKNAIFLEGRRQGWFCGGYSLIGGAPFGLFQSKGGASSFDYFGAGRKRHFCAKRDPLVFLQHWLNTFQAKGAQDDASAPLPFLQGGVAGFLAYELAQQLEVLPSPRGISDLPDMTLLFLNLFILVDHAQDAIHLIYAPAPEICMGADPPDVRKQAADKLSSLTAKLEAPSPLRPEFPGRALDLLPECAAESYMRRVRRAKDYIAAGDIFQANLSYRFSAPCPEASLFPLYTRLQAINPSPFSCYLNLGWLEVASGSPERLVRVKREAAVRIVETRPIAGTKPRGRNPGEDDAQLRALYGSLKEQAEHLMMVDLERNDLGRICRYGSVRVDEMMALERYSHVFHLVSNIRGELLPEATPLQVLRALFPGGTITGVPKIRCMEIISELEKRPRGIYTGAIGYIGFDGEMDFNIAIRTWVRQGGRMHCQVGAGIVADSDPASEYQETLQKAAALREALLPEASSSCVGRMP